MSELKTKKSRVNRVPSRGLYSKKDLFKVLDASFVCQIAFLHDGYPVVIPTAYGRDDSFVYIHGATSSRMIRELAKGTPCCFSVTLLDGLVLARSVFHHSMNYRSAIVFGKAQMVSDELKMEKLEIITEHILKGRWEEARLPNAKELKATSVMRIPMTEGSVKIRTGPPKDELEDYELEHWAGVIPLGTSIGNPEIDPDMKMRLPVPSSVLNFIEHG